MPTIRIPISHAMPGMTAAADVYSMNDQLIISKGTKLTNSVISRLKFYLIHDILIYQETSEKKADTSINTKIDTENSYMDVIRSSAEFKKFTTDFTNSLDFLQNELNDIATKKTNIDIARLLSQSTQVMSNCRNGIHVFDMLHCMRQYNDMTYVHSLNVALICTVFGSWLKLSQEDIGILTLCGLLHDVGKLLVPTNILNKPSILAASEFDAVKKHPTQGYLLLRSQNIDERIKKAAYMHHERCDGSGYPNALVRSQIDPFAKIVAIADVYDAMTSERSYRPALSPFEAIKAFESEGLQKYDAHYIMTFLEGIVQSYVGKRARLSNNTVGTIVMINQQVLSRPVIQVGKEFIDLSTAKNLEILSLA